MRSRRFIVTIVQLVIEINPDKVKFSRIARKFKVYRSYCQFRITVNLNAPISDSLILH